LTSSSRAPPKIEREKVPFSQKNVFVCVCVKFDSCIVVSTHYPLRAFQKRRRDFSGGDENL
jgi:hypothetical protein